MCALRIGVDVSPLSLTRAGSARHLSSLLAELEREPELELRRYSLGGSGRLTKVLRDTAWYLGLLPMRARLDGLDVLYCPTLRAPLGGRVRCVVTVHDVCVLRHPRTFNRWTRSYTAWALPRVARSAAAVATVSAFSKAELVETLGLDESRIHVIPNGVGPPFVAEGAVEHGEYILAVSTLEPRKNLPRLVEGFHRARLDRCELRVVGAKGWGGVRLSESGRIHWLGEVSDMALARLYRGALCTVYPSLYEGFGLPVLEAMACGSAVVASAIAPIEELAGEACVLVDGTDPEAIAEGLETAVSRRAELGALGPPRADAYSWQRSADKLRAVLHEVAR